MDFLRYPGGCYSRRVRIHPDDARLYTIRWFFAPKGAKLFPGWHSFASEVWRAHHDDPWDGIGEAEPERKWNRGINDGYLGKCFLGQLQWFDTGMPVAARNGPINRRTCCRPYVPGGIDFGGPSVFGVGHLKPGGLLLDGSAPVVHEAGAPGGLLLDGSAPVVHEAGAPGGLLIGGRTPLVRQVLASGGLLVGGEAPFAWSLTDTGTGGLLVGGAAPFAWSLTVASEGGLLVGGEAPFAWSLTDTGTGGLLVGGAAPFSWSLTVAGSGGLTIGGGAIIDSVSLTAGGLLIGGMSRFIYYSGTPPMPAYDMLASLTNSVNGLTNPTGSALLAGYWNEINATSASNALLPAPAVGAVALVEVLPGSTALFTLNPHAGELIDGSSVGRIMWAGESAILVSDGTNWYKVGGKTIPMACVMYRNASNQTLTSAIITQINLDATILDNTGLMADAVGHQITIKRPGLYDVVGQVGFSSIGAASTNTQSRIHVGASQEMIAIGVNTAGGSIAIPAVLPSRQLGLAVNVQLHGYQQSGGNGTVLAQANQTFLGVKEIPAW